MRTSDAAITAKELIRYKRYGEALEVLERAISSIHEYADWLPLAPPFQKVPQHLQRENPAWATAYGDVLVGVRAAKELLTFSEPLALKPQLPGFAPVLASRVWALLEWQRFEEAKTLAETVIPHLEGSRLGVVWRRLGQANFNLGLEWQSSFARARELLGGRLLGLTLMEEGTCWSIVDEVHQAHTLWITALDLLKEDPYHLAWVRFGLGNMLLRQCDADAERHFLEAKRLTGRKSAAALRSRVLVGLATFRRSLGEWSRAKTSYEEATKCASDPDDVRAAYWSLGRFYRLQKQFGQALEALAKALEVFKTETSPVYVEQAATLLALNRMDEARAALGRTGVLKGMHTWRADIVWAEIARRSGKPEEAVRLMASVPVHHLLAREERGSWPELFALVGSAGLPVPEPLSYIAQTQIEVMVLGMLRVWVNRRRVSIGATSRVGELLVLFLENKGQASVEKLISCLWPEALVKDKRGALWQLINDLRRTLGWPGSVQALRGGYMLDPTTQWNYDADNLRTIGGKSRVFLEGIYGGWVDEVRQELSGDEP